jgi:hypothetical protein
MLNTVVAPTESKLNLSDSRNRLAKKATTIQTSAVSRPWRDPREGKSHSKVPARTRLAQAWRPSALAGFERQLEGDGCTALCEKLTPK